MQEDFHERIARLKSENPIQVVASRLGLTGRGGRLWCPCCQSGGADQHSTPDLQIYGSSHVHCFKCSAHLDVLGLLQAVLSCSFIESLAWLNCGRSSKHHPQNFCRATTSTTGPNYNNILSLSIATQPPPLIKPHVTHPIYPQKNERPLRPVLQAYQQALPGSPGERYLASRGITLETAISLGLGYSAPGQWLSPRRDSPEGRLVVPHTDPNGMVVNLYGRALELKKSAPKHLRHDHIAQSKGLFNAQALVLEELILVEGPFDALSVYQSGYSNVAATFGVHGLHWDLVKAKRVVFAFDLDTAGEQAFQRHAYEGAVRGKRSSEYRP